MFLVACLAILCVFYLRFMVSLTIGACKSKTISTDASKAGLMSLLRRVLSVISDGIVCPQILQHTTTALWMYSTQLPLFLVHEGGAISWFVTQHRKRSVGRGNTSCIPHSTLLEMIYHHPDGATRALHSTSRSSMYGVFQCQSDGANDGRKISRRFSSLLNH